MDRKALRRLIICLIIVLMAAVSAVSCGKKTSDEERIRLAITSAVSSAEAKDNAGVLKYVSKDYKDDKGLDYNGIKGILFGELIRPGNVRIFVSAVSVEVKDDRAIAEAKAVLIRGKDVKSIKDVLPSDADGLKFTLLFKKEGNGWKVFNSSWERTGAAGLI